eukprot:TRINITY_DN80745_c0_g1_i1.p1 TRINITY_DN80745_c0_g1~~TRINITY_DN80745_c0_g1_i1.p1  ORF type:complete len:410 (+),score=93.43 TRINITY_DN80745_c0_g1_i1:49-1278(+)
MVVVTVLFNLEEQKWRHVFDVESGSTILKLKESMLNPPGTQQDVDSFELRRLGRRVPDFEKIDLDCELGFGWLGPEVGSEKARDDRRDASRWEMDQKTSTNTSASPGGGYPTAQTTNSVETVTVVIDRALDLKATVPVKAGLTVKDVKEHLVAQVLTGKMKIQDFELSLLGESTRLADSTLISKAHYNLQLQQSSATVGGNTGAEKEFFRATPATRPPGAQEKGPARKFKRWEVVGGADKGGILVREGQSTSSTQFPDRLATGSLIEELQLKGERLNYRRITGTGPETGWVSLSVSGKEIVKSKPQSNEELFNQAVALSLQEELMEGFGREDFQKTLAEIIKETPSKNGVKFFAKRNELFLSVQSVVLPRYGFEGSQKGVMQMMAAFGPLSATPEVAWNNDQLNKLLQM